MPIVCPYCQNPLGVKGAKPGRYATKCPKCTRKFQLTVPEDPTQEPVASPLKSETMAATVAGTQSGATQPATEMAPKPNPPLSPTLPGGTDILTSARESQPNPTIAGARPTITPGSQLPTDQGFEVDSEPSSHSSMTSSPPGARPTQLGGYQILEELGRGGMGAVYLARQLSLDRNVALKVMKPEWASSPTFVSRFTREAYAAAQLVHHNIVQIYDFGQDRGTNYFSMEFVQGETLASVVKSQKKLDPEVAVGYILQAARGLQYAHAQSMIHRDVKPDNLLLNDQGIVKVADLGLVKTPAFAEAEIARELDTSGVVAPGTVPLSVSSGQITMANVAMGTPAYMAPEQGVDAAAVDARADIYSLGCTLYDLVTGRPPFEGKSAYELITKHQSEPITPPEMIVKRVPKALSEIILKMVAKRPEDRYANLGQVIKALEAFLGISSTGPFSPREEHANLLGECVEIFNNAPTAKIRSKALLGAGIACGVIVLLSLLAKQFILAGGFLGLGFMTGLAYFLIAGFAGKTYLFTKVREVIFGNSLVDWLMMLATLVLGVTVLVVLKLVWAWVAFGIVAVLIATGIHSALDRKVEDERSEALDRTEEMLRSMRLHGLEEQTLRQFVCKYSGEQWEEFYETLFGYEAKITARDLWGRGDRGRLRKKYAAWRDPIIQWIDSKQQSRRAEREKRLLQKIEEKGLEAQGVNLMTARRRAHRAAEAMVTMAAEIKEASRQPAALKVEKPSIGQALRHAAEKPEEVLVDHEHGLYGPRTDGPLGTILGPKPRFLAGVVLAGACLLWMHQNDMLTQENLKAASKTAQELASQGKELARKAVKTKDANFIKDIDTTKISVETTGKTPLKFPFLPANIASRFFNNYNALAAGLILILSSFFAGVRMSAFAIPAAVITFAGPTLGVPGLNQTISILAGSGIAVAGWFFGRAR